MANLPEKNITTVDKITSIPSNTNLYINANGEFRQATIDDVLKASPVIADSITNQYKNASGSPILLTDSAKGVVIDFDVKGRSTQDGEPTPTEPITPKSNGDMGYFDGELSLGMYATDGSIQVTNNYVAANTLIPCTIGDNVMLTYEENARLLIVLFNNGSFVQQIARDDVTEVSTTIPSGVTHFGITIKKEGITPQTAKHICVTINDKYALIEKSVGKNLLKNTATSYSKSGVTVTVNNDKTITLNGTCVEGASYVVELATNLKLYAGQYVMTGNPLQGYNYRIAIKVNGVYYTDNGNGVTFTVNETTYCEVFFIVNGGTTYNNTTYKSMIRPLGTDATYEPYTESRKYTPISAPLRSSLDGSVKDVARFVDGEVDRKFTEIVLDGSESGWIVSGGFAIITVSDAISTNLTYGELLCSHFRYAGQSADIGVCFNYNQRFHFAIEQTTLDEWLAWLQANPITVIYELAEPTTESIEPIDVDTFEGVTHISVSDDADMEVEYPTSKVAGIASIGWSKGRRAEYDLEQLKVQMLALQTTIVSTV